MKFTKETKIGRFEVEIKNVVWKNRGRQVQVAINNKEATLLWVTRQGRTGVEVTSTSTQELLGKKMPDVILEVPAKIKKDVDALFTELLAKKEADRQQRVGAIKASETKITVQWCEGSPLSGWAFAPGNDDAVDLLCDLGIAKPVSGWGIIVDSKFVAAVGQEFTYADAVDYTAPKKAKEEAKAKKEEERINKAIEQAKNTGKDVEISRFCVPCQSAHEECSTDIIVRYATPEGKTEAKQHHTW